MKKFMSGLIVGLLLTTTVFASSEQIQAVFTDFNFVINGQDVELQTKPLNVDGTSYLPVRELAETLGYHVDFRSDTGTIVLNNSVKPKSSEKELSHAERILEERHQRQELEQQRINEKYALPLDEVFELIDHEVITDHPELEDWQVGFSYDYKVLDDDIRINVSLQTNKDLIKRIRADRKPIYVYPNDTIIEGMEISYRIQSYNRETFENELHNISQKIPLDINISR